MPRTGHRSRGSGAGPRPPHHPVRDRFGDPGSLTLSLLPITARWFPTSPPSTAKVSMFRACCPTYPTPYPTPPLRYGLLELWDRRRSAHSCMNPQAPASPRGRLTEIPQRPKALFSPVASWPRGPRSASPGHPMSELSARFRISQRPPPLRHQNHLLFASRNRFPST